MPWSFSTEPAEHLDNVEWHFTPQGGSETIVATQVMGSFVLASGLSARVQFIPNAGLALTNVAIGDAGTYTVYVDVTLHGSVIRQSQTVELRVTYLPVTSDNQLHVQVMRDAVYDNSTRQYHVQLSCGSFLSFWGPSGVSVSWKTPSNQTLYSTTYHSGRFLLSVPNPVESGPYTCVLDNSSPAALCLASDSPLRGGATVTVDGVESRFAILETQIKELQAADPGRNCQQDNSALRQELESRLSALETQYQQEKATLQQQLDQLRQDNTVLTNTLTAKIQKAATSISFHAWRNHWDRTLMSGDTVVFEQVISNEGSAYHPDTGLFTVPFDGTYAFFLTVVTDETSPTLENTDAGLYADDVLLSSTYSSYDAGHHESGTCQAVVRLKAGQRVFVRNLNSDARYYPTYSTFSGALLHVAVR